MKEIKLAIGYHQNQRKIFFESDARYKVIAKGRRFGLTKGFANYVIENMLDGKTPVLWMDTTYSNIERYVERYFFPILKQLPKNLWKYRANRSDLKIINSVCDFRSADKPENIEGFGYALIVLNEAGIILKNRRLWEESIRPMILDYKADVLIGGTPKGKMNKGKNEKHLFFELFERGTSTPLSTGTSTVLQNSLQAPLSAGENQKSEERNKNDSCWKSFQYSSYDNPLIDKNEIDEMAKEISPMLRDQEIYGKFVDGSSAGIIKRDWWKYYTKDELEKLRFIKRVQSWDTAFKKNEENDFSVCTTWEIRQNGFYLIDLWRGRVEFPELKKIVVKLFNDYKPNEVLIEDKASGQSLIQELQRETRIPIKPIKVNTDKIARVHSITPLIEAGKVFLPGDPSTASSTGSELRLGTGVKGETVDLINNLINECEEFPNSEFDDIVDSVSQFLNEAKIVNAGNVESIMHLERSKNKKVKRKFYKRMIGYTKRTLMR